MGERAVYMDGKKNGRCRSIFSETKKDGAAQVCCRISGLKKGRANYEEKNVGRQQWKGK